MKKRIIIVGKGGSGKDHLRKILVDRGFKYCTSHTSRSPRDGEIDGIDYWFVDESVFLQNPDSFYEYVQFNGWYYGTSIIEFHRADLFIMTPSGILKLDSEDRKESTIVYLDIEESVLKQRLMDREDADDWERRLKSDRSDFDGFEDFDILIKDPLFSGDFEWIDDFKNNKI